TGKGGLRLSLSPPCAPRARLPNLQADPPNEREGACHEQHVDDCVRSDSPHTNMGMGALRFAPVPGPPTHPRRLVALVADADPSSSGSWSYDKHVHRRRGWRAAGTRARVGDGRLCRMALRKGGSNASLARWHRLAPRGMVVIRTDRRRTCLSLRD